MNELKLETVNARWKNMWSEAVNDFKGFRGIDLEVKKIIQRAREVGGEGFVDLIYEDFFLLVPKLAIREYMTLIPMS